MMGLRSKARRDLVRSLWRGVLGLGIFAFFAPVHRLLSAAAPRPEAPSLTTDEWARLRRGETLRRPALLVRPGPEVLSLRCPHLGCTVRETSDGFVCPCHGSRFSRHGERLSGPAPRGLEHLTLRGGPP